MHFRPGGLEWPYVGTRLQQGLFRADRIAVAWRLVGLGLSRRQAAGIVVVHRCTVRGWTPGIAPDPCKPLELRTPRGRPVWALVECERQRGRVAAVGLLERKHDRAADERDAGAGWVARPALSGRARVAAALRDRHSNAEAARLAGCSVSAVERLKRDPHFRALYEQRMLVHAGHAPEHRPVGGSTDLLSGEPSRCWIEVGSATVLGSVLHPLASPEVTDNRHPDSGKPGPFSVEVAASVVQVALVSEPSRIAVIREALEDGRVPAAVENERTIAITYAGL